jgi:hypothetical protein
MSLSDKPPDSEHPHAALRGRALAATVDDLGPAGAGAPVLALLMETGYPEVVATLAGFADGTTSLYFSNGGAVVGAGEHEPVAAATRRWLEAAVSFLDRLEPVAEPPLPEVGMTSFVAVTPDGLVGAGAPEGELGDWRHELSPLFHAAHEVLTEIRKLGVL